MTSQPLTAFAAVIATLMTFGGSNASAFQPWQPVGQGAGWRRVSPARSGVSIAMPGEPEHSVRPIEGSGLKFESHSYILFQNGTLFGLVHCTYPDELGESLRTVNPDSVFGFWKERLIGGLPRDQFSTASQSDTRVDGVDGREYVLRHKDGAILFIRVYWTGTSVSALMYFNERLRARADLASSLGPDGRRFFDSLELTAGPPPPTHYEDPNPPLLSTEDQMWLGKQMMQRSSSVAEARQLAEAATLRTLESLTPTEKAEVDTLLADAFATLPTSDLDSFINLQGRIDRGDTLSASESSVHISLLRRALLGLPAARLARLQFVFGHALRRVVGGRD